MKTLMLAPAATKTLATEVTKATKVFRLRRTPLPTFVVMVFSVAVVVMVFSVAFVSVSFAAPQEREVPKDSALVTLRGCANGRNFIVAPRSEDQPGTLEIESGRRLRLSGPGKLLDEIKKRERMMVEITGLVKKSQIQESGIAVAGGRIRIGGTVPQSPISDPRRDPAYNQTIIDVTSYRPLPDPCRDR